MKTILYVMVALFMSTAFYSCTPEAIQETTELSTEDLATEGENNSGTRNENPDPDAEEDNN